MRLSGNSISIHVIPVLVLAHHVPQKGDVANGQLQGVHFTQPLLVGQRRDVRTEPLKRLVDALHATPFPQIRRLSLLGLLRGALGPPQLGAAVAEGDVAEMGRLLL